jgi:hypothetical protein
MGGPVLCTHRRELDGARCVLNADHVEREAEAPHGYARPAPPAKLAALVAHLEDRDPHANIPRRTAARLIRDAMGWE